MGAQQALMEANMLNGADRRKILHLIHDAALLTFICADADGTEPIIIGL
jgi:hypothetical protein